MIFLLDQSRILGYPIKCVLGRFLDRIIITGKIFKNFLTMKNNNRLKEKQIMWYLSIYINDPVLNVWHLSILTAILGLGYRQGERRKIKVSRSKIMQLSHVNTLPTYHKYFKQLQDLGYIKYTPSYHPGYKSEVKLCKKRLSQNI